MDGRDSFLGIEQDETCVNWQHLVTLRTYYNLIWDMLNECEVAEGDRYGEPPKAQETADLPTVEGFFRVELSSTPDGNGGYVVTPIDAKFIVSGGTLLSRINDASYTYISGASPFNVILKDECNNCSVFHPSSYIPAVREVICPEGGAITLYEGGYALDVGSASPGCGGMLNWGANLDILYDHVELFESIKDGDVLADCSEIVQSCCSLYSQAHYEFVEEGVFVLKFVDIYVDAGGGAATGGYMSTLIFEDDLNDIFSRIYSDLDNIKLNAPVYCDICATDLDNTWAGCYDIPAGNTSAHAVRCNTNFFWEWLIGLNYVTGLGAVDPDDCESCGEEFADIICACPWEQLAGVMAFVLEWGCVTGCDPPNCLAEKETWVEVTSTVNEGEGYSCGVSHEGSTYASMVTHYYYEFICSDPGDNFTCGWDVASNLSGPSIIGPEDECGSFEDEEPEEDCEDEECPGGGGFRSGPHVASVDYSGLISASSILAYAEDHLVETVTSHGRLATLDCTYFSDDVGSSLGGVLGQEIIYSAGDEAFVKHTVLEFEMKGDVIEATLHWTETLYYLGAFVSSTPRSAAFNSGNGYKVVIDMEVEENESMEITSFHITVP